MTAPTTFDPDLVKAARALRYENPAGWRKFITQHPELADAAKPEPDKSTGSPDGYEPYQCWSHPSHRTDGGRWYRNRGYQPEGADARADNPDDRDRSNQLPSGSFGASLDDHHWTSGSLVDLHMEVNGGTGSSPKGNQGWTLGYHAARNPDGSGELRVSDPRQLEVCRLCGREINLPRDSDGFADRSVGAQSQYCSVDHRREVKNARERALRAAKKPTQAGPLPDLSSIDVAGIGDMAISPAKWNRLQPRRDPHGFMPIPGGHREGYKLPVHRFISNTRHRPCWAADKWIRVGRRSNAMAAERIARRYRAAGTGTPRGPELSPGWDRITSSWTFVSRSAAIGYRLSCENNNVWQISHCNAA